MKLFISLDNQALHQHLVSFASEERRVTLEVLQHLRECERRKLFAERGHSSLFEYVVAELHYSESAAQRRISAMRALKDLPEFEEKVQSGELKVTQLARVQTFLRTEKKAGKAYSQEQKRNLILDTVGKSSRETDRLLAEKSPAFAAQEKMRVLTPDLTQVTFTANEALMENLQKIRNVFAHQLPVASSTAEVIAWMADRILESHAKRVGEDPLGRKEVHSVGRKEVDSVGRAKERNPKSLASSSPSVQGQKALPAPQVRSRYIPVEVRRAVWTRDRGKCAFVSRITGKHCESRHRIQIDHITPFALGGISTDPRGLRLLCFTHNQSESKRLLGVRGG